MPSRIGYITVDSAVPGRAAEFWAAALGWLVGDTWADGDDEGTTILDPEAYLPGIAFIKVPEAKTVKNRLHFDLTPPRTRDEEVRRLEGLGASPVEGFAPQGASWVVMADPEGNEFCVIAGPADSASRED